MSIPTSTMFFDYKGDCVRREKRMTFREYMDLNKEFAPGTLIFLYNADLPSDGHTEYESFYVGECTPFHEPSNNDGGFGWDDNHPRYSKFVGEVYLPKFKSNPAIDDEE